jgi:sugar phosphate isomerase/epimerase
MKLGLHANAYAFAAGLRDELSLKRAPMTAVQLLERAAKLKFEAVQVPWQLVAGHDLVAAASLGNRARELKLLLHLSAAQVDGEHLTEAVHRAHYLGAPQVTVAIAQLAGSVQQRQRRLEALLLHLDGAIKTAERYEITLGFENGRHTAATDLAAFVQAAQSPRVAACFDTGNALTVPEDPVESAGTLASICTSIHLKDYRVYRTRDGVTLLNCPLGEGSVPLGNVLRVLRARQPELPAFVQIAADRIHVPLLQDEFLRQYPRITARALAGILRTGVEPTSPEDLIFPHDRHAPEREVLKWEDDRVKRSLHGAYGLLGDETLTLSLGG